jgi:hypothetical protein
VTARQRIERSNAASIGRQIMSIFSGDAVEAQVMKILATGEPWLPARGSAIDSTARR